MEHDLNTDEHIAILTLSDEGLAVDPIVKKVQRYSTAVTTII